MDKLKIYFATHLPRINSALESEIRDLNPLVKPVAEHVLGAGGKRLRPMLCLLTAGACGYRGDDIMPLGCALEFLHSATLLHDDILDEAELRRGRDAAHLVHGTRETILAGDALLAQANRLIADYDVPSLMSCVSTAIVETASGEILEIARMQQTTLTRVEYLEIIRGKTAFLIQAASECGAILAGADTRLRQAAKTYGLNLGIAFQLVDDALDYAVSAESSGKPRGGDLKEGKLTLPLILYLESLEEQDAVELLHKIKLLSLTTEEQRQVLSAIERMELAQQTRQEASTYLETARQALGAFPSSAEKELLKDILDYVQHRKS